jgi:hypothetical protein
MVLHITSNEMVPFVLSHVIGTVVAVVPRANELVPSDGQPVPVVDEIVAPEPLLIDFPALVEHPQGVPVSQLSSSK